MADGTEEIKKELNRVAEEAAAIFQDALTSIAATFGEKLREETSTLDDAQKTLLRNFKNNIASTARGASSLLDIQSKLRDGSIKQRDLDKAKASIDSQINKLSVDKIALLKSGVELSNKENERAKDAIKFAEDRKAELQEIEDIQNKINRELGISGGLFSAIDKIFKSIGISNPFGEALEKTKAARGAIALNNKEIKDLGNSDKKRVKFLKEQNETLQSQTSLADNIAESFSLTNLYSAAALLVLNKMVGAFQRLNEAQVASLRNTGEIVNINQQFNDSLLLGADYLDQINSLTEQFGFNTTKAFDALNIEEAAELTKFMGLAAGEANALALNAQISGENLKEGADQAVRAINPAFSQRKILQDIAKLSASIAISFGNSNVALAKAASDAKELGLNLDQVDKIAGGLLDIESSIAKEFEAEVISGKQLNLERARYFALTNDLAGVTKELTNQGITQKSFAESNRIEQEAVAGAIGLSRDELAASLREQALLSTMSAEEIKAKEASDLKALTAQQMLNDSIAKMAEIVAIPAAAFAAIASSTAGMVVIFAALTPLIASFAVKAVTAAVATLSMKGFIGVALVAGLLGAIALATKSVNSQQVEDGIAPSSKGPFTITDSFGATAITAKGDGLAVSPNISRENTRNNNTQLDYEKLANAIAMGAEKGTSRANVTTNLDGSKVSNRIQAPLAMSTRKYSV